MAHHSQTKDEAIRLRKNGFSLKEISSQLHIAKSTASAWLSLIELSPLAQSKLAKKQILGQYKTVLLKRKQKIDQQQIGIKKAQTMLNNTTLNQDLSKLCCALMWWCEGNKNSSFLRFTSSDVTLITNFLSLLRSSFVLDESKLRVLMHLHAYHNEAQQKKYWSNITKISEKQFHKSFQKENTGKRVKENYPGCIAVTYYDVKIAKELEAIYNAFTNLRGVR